MTGTYTYLDDGSTAYTDETGKTTVYDASGKIINQLPGTDSGISTGPIQQKMEESATFFGIPTNMLLLASAAAFLMLKKGKK